ncbi:hypothetical protein GQ651_09025 [Alphaproteobacteria bacterium GH1-50]|uniref:Transcriptional activator HlyU n=1 Tax=Kangsaoukella pontilimi TaxID=2691042 RepID=A0A7C9IRW2_9RHOB|nr:hypothetical protein [Kangsaoukella pontilimi]
MSILKRLFGGGGSGTKTEAEATDHNGFSIVPNPQKEAGGWRVGARIEKGGKVHQLIRADTIQDQDQAIEASVRKAKQVIDEQGERLFG